MSNEFPRTVHGYNFDEIVTGGGTVKAGSMFTISTANYPGEVLGISISQLSGTRESFYWLSVRITWDGIVIFDDYLYYLSCGFPYWPFHGHFSACDVTADIYTHIQFRFVMPYENAISFRFSSEDANGNLVYANLHYRFAG